MALNFPSNPSNNQVYTFGSRSWTWSNTAGIWLASSTTIGYAGSFGYTGSKGDTGFVGSTGYTGSFGATGFTGSIGYTGSFGITGYTGSLGYTGSFGYSGSQGANSLYTTSNTAPSTPTSGDRWFNTDIGAEFVYTYDGDSSQWVEIAASGFIGQSGYTGSAGPSTFPLNNQTSSYVATANDNGGLIYTTSNVVINTSVFSNGQNFTVFNNASSNVTIVANGVTLYYAGTSSTGNRTLYQKGIASVICVTTNTFAISGTIA